MIRGNNADLVVIGGGASGALAAIVAKEKAPKRRVVLVENSDALLRKVRLSGGGRCNLTNALLSVHQLSRYYPRGAKELRGPFHQFGPQETMDWFSQRGVPLITEAEGRVFPASHSSQTIVSCLVESLQNTGVEIQLKKNISHIERNDAGFVLTSEEDEPLVCRSLILATGGSTFGYTWASRLGHTIVTPVPALFSFAVPKTPFKEHSGVAIGPVTVRIINTRVSETGSLLLTHTGFSGPVILKASSFAARYLFESGYKAEMSINWAPNLSEQDFFQQILALKNAATSGFLSSHPLFGLTKNLWKTFLSRLRLLDTRLADLSHQQIRHLYQTLHDDKHIIDGSTSSKDEFVTCGGVSTSEIEWKTMESRICPNLFIVGELLDVDGITGGFNLQNAWTTGWIAGSK